MKKLIILSAATFILAATVNAQAGEEPLVKNDIAELKKQESAIRKEKLDDKKELKKLTGKDVSYQSKQQFRDDFGNIPGTTWKRTANFDEATFTRDGQVFTACYDAGSKLVGTTSDKSFTDLPYKAQKYINEKYKDYTVTAVLLYDDNELNETDMVLYNLQFDDVDSYFVELKNENKEIVLQVHMDGDVSYFTRVR